MSNHRIPMDRQILVSAVRYALGRQTYIVSWTVHEVLRVWPSLDTGTRTLIQRDVAEAMRQPPPLHISDVDRPDWQRILEAPSDD